MRPACDDKLRNIQYAPQSWYKLDDNVSGTLYAHSGYIHIDGSNSTSSILAQNKSTAGGFWSKPPMKGLAATIAILHSVLNESFVGLIAIKVPCVNLFDCSHRILLPALSWENSTRNAGPVGLSLNPLIWTF
jgi:hypothetical protein